MRRTTRLTLLEKLQHEPSDMAWDEFVRIYRDYIFGIARRMNLSHADCDDVCQTVLTKVWSKIGDFDHDGRPGRFRAWLTTTTRNTVLHLIQKRTRLIARDGAAAQLDEQVALPDIARIAEEEWDQHVSNLAWQTVRKSLSEVTQQVFELSLDGLSRQQIADRLGIPPNTVSVYKKRVIAKLQKEIQWLLLEIS